MAAMIYKIEDVLIIDKVWIGDSILDGETCWAVRVFLVILKDLSPSGGA
jgi:hypothetical protein